MQEQQRHNHGEEDVPEDTVQHIGEAATHGKDAKEKLDADIDAILDEIDGVLEENAEDFVKAFVQKGGQ